MNFVISRHLLAKNIKTCGSTFSLPVFAHIVVLTKEHFLADPAATIMRPPLIPQTIPIYDQDSELTKLLKTLFNSLVEYREPNTGRIAISLFMCLPSRKDFPEYFNIIDKPISMYEIRKRIESSHYTSVEPCINDFKSMFNNCRTFNEDGSMIFDDSLKLERIVLEKYNQLRPNIGVNGIQSVMKPVKSATINVEKPPATPTLNNHDQTNNHRGQHLEKNNHNTSINSNLISQSSNGFPSEDSNSNSNIITSSILNEDSLSGTPFHNDASMDSSSSIQERPAKRSKRDNDQPKKRVLTGYIIYAAEVRKEYVDKNPNQDFGYISRLIGNDWRALPRDLKQKYEHRAIIQNNKLAREAEKREQNRVATPTSSSTTNSTPVTNAIGSNTTYTTKKHKLSHVSASKFTTHQQQQAGVQAIPYAPSIQTETATQTTPARFVEPPKRMPYNYTEIYKRFLGEDYCEITHEHVYGKKNGGNSHHLGADSAESWLGAGIGRHASTGDALWALREFMLQDAATMRWSLQPYQ